MIDSATCIWFWSVRIALGSSGAATFNLSIASALCSCAFLTKKSPMGPCKKSSTMRPKDAHSTRGSAGSSTLLTRGALTHEFLFHPRLIQIHNVLS